MSPAILSHIAPFAVWIAFILLFQMFDCIGIPLPDAWLAPAYAVKSLICAALLLCLKPWRFYEEAKSGTAAGVALGGLAGVVLAVIWVLPETTFVRDNAPAFFDFYNKWLIMPLSAFPDYFSPEHFPAIPPAHASLAYAPTHCGWTLTIFKLLGSAFVISFAEEYFFRGFLYRWLRKGDFTSIPLAKYDAQIFWLVVLVFGLEHDRWFAGMIAGVVFGWIVLRTGRILPAAIAHAVTNLLLGLHVIISNQYGFW